MEGKYKYYVVMVLVVIFLIYICYPSDIPCLGTESYLRSTESYLRSAERFTERDYPGSSTINGLSDVFADRLANDTYRKVVEPCKRLSERATVVDCIANYDSYFHNVLKDHVIDMFTKLKGLNGIYVDFITEITTQEQREFAITVSKAFSVALTETLSYLMKNYSGDDKYDQVIFTSTFAQYLTYNLREALHVVFNMSRTPVKPAKTVPILTHQPQQAPKKPPTSSTLLKNIVQVKTDSAVIPISSNLATINALNVPEIPKSNTLNVPQQKSQSEIKKVEDIQSKKFYLKCEDLINNRVQIFIDGVRISCV